jgi:hypothetical protein
MTEEQIAMSDAHDPNTRPEARDPDTRPEARDPVQELKIRAEILQHRLERAEPDALPRLRSLRELKTASTAELAAHATRVQRKHCLAVVAREAGFDDWLHASTVLSGESCDDFGTLLCLAGSAAHWNIWSAAYEEARAIREEHGGYLLAFKRQFFITDRFYLETLGLDPEDPDWDALGRDWARPRDPDARRRLYAKLLTRTAA